MMIRRLRQSLQIEESYLPETCPFLCKCPTVLYIGSAIEVKATPVPGTSKEFLVALIVAPPNNNSQKSSTGSSADLPSPSSNDSMMDNNSINSQGDEVDNNSDGRNSGCNSDSDSEANNIQNSTTIALQLRPKLNSCGTILCSAGNVSTNKKVEESTVRLASNPFMVNRSFSLIFLVQQDCYQVIINGEHVMDFCHRVRAENVTHLLLDGDAIFEHVAFYSGLQRPPGILRSNSSIERFISLRQSNSVKRYQQQQQLSSLLALKLCRSSSLPENSTTNDFGQQQQEEPQQQQQQQQVKVKRQAPPPPRLVSSQTTNNNNSKNGNNEGSVNNNNNNSNNTNDDDKSQDEKLVVVKENNGNKPSSTNKPRLFIKGSQRGAVRSESAGILMTESKALRTLRPHIPHKIVD